MVDAGIIFGFVTAWAILLYSIYSYGDERRIAKHKKRKGLPVIPDRISDFVTCHNLNRLDNRQWGRYCNTVVALKHEFPVLCPTCGARVF